MNNIDDLVVSLAQDAGAIKPAPHPYVLSLKLIGSGAIYILAALSIAGLRPDWIEKFHSILFVAELLALVGLFCVTSLSAALLGFPDQFQKRYQVWAPIGMFALFFLLLFFVWLLDREAAPLPVHSFECTISITLTALLPAVWTFYALRKYASTNARLAGSVSLLSAFSIGALWLRLHEETDSVVHVIEWHYLPMLVIGIIGLWLGKRLLKW